MAIQTHTIETVRTFQQASPVVGALPDVAQSFRNLLTQSIPVLRAFAISLSSRVDLADDLVQETLTKAWKYQGKFQPGTNLRAWLFTILRNEYYSMRRKRRREVEDGNDFYAGQLATPGAQESTIAIIELRIALAGLPDEQRDAILLIGALGVSYGEAATTCGVPVGTMKSRVSRARARLKTMLELEPIPSP
jgi:RNA polymerase sigma-70 factor (ECF subfamily)